MMNDLNDTGGERGGGSLERVVRPLLDYAAPAHAWRLTEKKARMVLESGRPTQIVGLVIRDMDTGQTTVIDQSTVMTLHPSQWNEVMHPKRPNADLRQDAGSDASNAK